MRYTYSTALQDFLDGTANTGSTDVNLTSFFNRRLTARYQMAYSEIKNRTTQGVYTGNTVVGQQYYHYPPGIVDLADCTVTINGLAYPIITDDSILQWDRINLVLISTTSLPQFAFPRKDDFGIWPIPQGIFPINIVVQLRDRTPSAVDYAVGTVTLTNGSQAVVGVGTIWTQGMVGRWFTMNDNTQPGYGYWYRIGGVTDATHLTLETAYVNVSVTGATYNIGETFELPEEVHPHIVSGVISDYYAGPRSDVEKATWHDNVFWTGSGLERERDGKKFSGGMLGAKQRYSGRQEGAIVWKHGLGVSWWDRQWATKIS